MWKWVWKWVMGRVWKRRKTCDSQRLDCLQETISGNIDIKRNPGETSESKENTYIVKSRMLIQNIKGTSGEVSYRNKKCYWKLEKGDPFHKGAENLAEDIPKQSIKGMAWLLFADYSKMGEEREKLKKG